MDKELVILDLAGGTGVRCKHRRIPHEWCWQIYTSAGACKCK